MKKSKKEVYVITRVNHQVELRNLARRREELRNKLRDHFCLPISKRNYKEFESVVDELDELRRKMLMIKTK